MELTGAGAGTGPARPRPPLTRRRPWPGARPGMQPKPAMTRAAGSAASSAYVDVALGLLAVREGPVPGILLAHGVSAPSLRAAILDRYRQAS